MAFQSFWRFEFKSCVAANNVSYSTKELFKVSLRKKNICSELG